MAHGHGEVIKHISNSYRHLHAIYGIGPTVGLAATGEAARAAEGYLLQAHREQRELTEREVISLKKALERLRGLPPRRYPIDVSTRGIGLDSKSLGAAFPSA
jgi:HPt (histidine-containing phosphotransfer) domain-containing protein